MNNVIILDEKKRPLSTKRKALSYIILILSLVNLVQLSLALFGSFSLNTIVSGLLSIVGIVAFWAIQKQHFNAGFWVMFWIIPQLIIFINYPYFSIDLSQGYSFPLGIKFWAKQNDVITRLFDLSFNFLPLLYLWLWRDKK